MTKKIAEPAGNASTEEWRAYATQQDPEAADAIAVTGRDELRDRYAAPDEPKPAVETPDLGPAFVNVTPASPTEVPDSPRFRVSISDQQWDREIVEFPHGEPGETVRIDRRAPLVTDEDTADALISAAGEHGFALTKEQDR